MIYRNTDTTDIWINLFTDGIVKLNAVWAAGEGVTYKQDGQWIAGYNRYLGFYSVFEVELYGILDGLPLFKGREAFQDTHVIELTLALVGRIDMILQSMEQWEIKHILREWNQVADKLTKMALEKTWFHFNFF